MKKLVLSLLLPISLFAQDINLKGNSALTDVVTSTNTNTAAQDRIAVHGYSLPQPNWGIGVKGEAGYIGVYGQATLTGAGTRYGGYFFGANGTSSNIGVQAQGSSSAVASYGVLSYAYGTAGSTTYALYGSASGGTTNYGVYCSGDGVYTGSWTKVSDIRTKKNIQVQSGSLAKLMALGVKRYDFDQVNFSTMNLKSKSEVGVIAQEVEKILPELVNDIVVPGVTSKDAKGKEVTTNAQTLKGVDYIGLVPFLLQAIQEQQLQIEALKKKVGG